MRSKLIPSTLATCTVVAIVVAGGLLLGTELSAQSGSVAASDRFEFGDGVDPLAPDAADIAGSTGKILRTVEAAPAGTRWAIGTELHMVNRLKAEHPEQEIHFLSPIVCMCATMYRINLAHLCWSLENLAAGTPVNVIEVDEETAKWSLVALERMLQIK